MLNCSTPLSTATAAVWIQLFVSTAITAAVTVIIVDSAGGDTGTTIAIVNSHVTTRATLTDDIPGTIPRLTTITAVTATLVTSGSCKTYPGIIRHRSIAASVDGRTSRAIPVAYFNALLSSKLLVIRSDGVANLGLSEWNVCSCTTFRVLPERRQGCCINSCVGIDVGSHEPVDRSAKTALDVRRRPRGAVVDLAGAHNRLD